MTTRIKQLETSIGVQLFFRERQRLILSPSGYALLGYADRLLRLAAEARAAVTGRDPCGVLRLGALESTCASRLPPVLARFHKAFPDVRVELQTGTNDALTAAVKDRRLDAAFVVEIPADATLSARAVFREQLVLISSRQHLPIARPRDIAGDSIIAFPRGCASESVLDTVSISDIARHALPRVLGQVVTPLIWRSEEASAAVMALREQLASATRPR